MATVTLSRSRWVPAAVRSGGERPAAGGPAAWAPGRPWERRACADPRQPVAPRRRRGPAPRGPRPVCIRVSQPGVSPSRGPGGTAPGPGGGLPECPAGLWRRTWLPPPHCHCHCRRRCRVPWGRGSRGPGDVTHAERFLDLSPRCPRALSRSPRLALTALLLFPFRPPCPHPQVTAPAPAGGRPPRPQERRDTRAASWPVPTPVSPPPPARTATQVRGAPGAPGCTGCSPGGPRGGGGDT